MKMLISIALLFVTINCFAQKDYCKDIEKLGNNIPGATTYKTPYKLGSPNLVAFKHFKDGKSIFSITFAIGVDKPKADLTGLFIKFSDGEELNLPDFKIIATRSPTFQYSYTAWLELDPAYISLFTSKAISKYTLSSKSESVGSKWGNNFKNWLSCLNTITEN